MFLRSEIWLALAWGREDVAEVQQWSHCWIGAWSTGWHNQRILTNPYNSDHSSLLQRSSRVWSLYSRECTTSLSLVWNSGTCPWPTCNSFLSATSETIPSYFEDIRSKIHLLWQTAVGQAHFKRHGPRFIRLILGNLIDVPKLGAQ